MTAEPGQQIERDDGSKFWWPLCATKFCQNLICLRYSEKFCYIHMPADARARKDADK